MKTFFILIILIVAKFRLFCILRVDEFIILNIEQIVIEFMIKVDKACRPSHQLFFVFDLITHTSVN